MHPIERIFAVAEGKEADRVPTLSILVNAHPVHQVLGYPKVSEAPLLFSPLGSFIVDHLADGPLGRLLVERAANQTFFKCFQVAVDLGFDAAWGAYGPSLTTITDSKTLRDDFGFYNQLIDDGHGNITYMYREPAITSPQAYRDWPYFPDPDQVAHRSYLLYKKAQARFADKICIFGEANSDMYTKMAVAMGFTNLALYIRKDPDFIRDFVARMEEFAMKTTMAIMDAGVRVILKADDMSTKTGPQMNPKVFDSFWGPAYRRLCRVVHDRGGKIFIHACGDNTKLFDNFISWGFDGGHAFETTSNVDIFHEKKAHGDRFTIIGGMGVDYHLTRRSSAVEVAERTRELIKHLAPGGRFIMAPVHSHSDLDMSKERVMIETVREHGTYPIR
jgi:hypothetical protein